MGHDNSCKEIRVCITGIAAYRTTVQELVAVFQSTSRQAELGVSSRVVLFVSVSRLAVKLCGRAMEFLVSFALARASQSD